MIADLARCEKKARERHEPPFFRSLGPERMGFPFPLRLVRGCQASPRSWSVGLAEVTQARGQDVGYQLVAVWGAIRRCLGKGSLGR